MRTSFFSFAPGFFRRWRVGFGALGGRGPIGGGGHGLVR